MEINILEDPDLKNSVEDLFGSISLKYRLIYIILLCSVLLAGILMAVIRIPVSCEFRGILRPSSEKKQLFSSVSGTIREIHVMEDQSVSYNQKIITFNTDEEKGRMELLKQDLKRTQEWLKDCLYLINHHSFVNEDSLSTARYRSEYLLRANEQKILEFEISRAETDISRLRTLEKDSLISKKEMEDMESKLLNLLGKQKSQFSTNLGNWHEQLDILRRQESSLLKEISSLEYFIGKAEIRAPASGTIQGIRSIYPGYYCQAGKYLCELIPDTALIVEMYIPSEKTGFIRPGMKTRFKIDAFDYKYWGFLEGKCLTVARDYELIENRPYFRVTCQPEEPCRLSYRNKTVILNPGMTLASQFILAERTIWQLLRDEVYDWISE